jgi:primosomal protein N' (replication factor Y)
MQIVTVIPISRGISKETLTYFTKSDVTLGGIVKIPLRKKVVFGLIVDTKDVSQMKSEIKSLPYSIKKVEEMQSGAFLTRNFTEAVKKIADYNATSIGSVLFSLIPKYILEESSQITLNETLPLKDAFNETVLLQCDSEERFATYKSLVREEFAKNHSVYFCVPTIEDLHNAKLLLERGIENYTYTLHSGLSKKEMLDAWGKICQEKHPVLIIGTGSFLSIPKNNIGTIILEKESSRGYKMQTRPFLDIRNMAETIAREMKVRLVLGDMFLRSETLWEEKNGRYAPLSPLKFRSLSSANCELVDMRTPQDMKSKDFKIIGDKLVKIIENNIQNNEHLFLFCSRKGLAPSTVCSDCGTTVSCTNCHMPVVLYGRKNDSGGAKNIFICNHCGEKYDTKILCSHCGGWRLTPLGIGIEKVVEEIEKMFPNAKIIVFDKEHITTQKKAEKTRDLFYNTPGSICIGTEMALSYLNNKIDNTAVVTLDSYFSIPDFQISEKVFHTLLEMRHLSTQNFLIQTRQEDTKIFEHALKGNLMDFYRNEIDERKLLGYPPFNTYIKITLEGDKNTVRKEMEKVKEFFLPFKLQIFDAFIKIVKNKHVVHGLVYMEKNSWPDKNLLEKLKQLPPQFSIRIDPGSLL